MLGAPELRAMKDHATLINTARGSLVDTAALEAECATGRINALLDVTEPEPLPPDHPFWNHSRILLTPHVASQTRPESAALAVIDNLRRHAAGEPLIGLVDRTRGY